MPWKFGTAMDIGGRKEQQDRLAIFKSRNARRILAVIADGMGGLRNGAQAAQTVIDIAAHWFKQQNDLEPQAFLQNICIAAHDAINCIPIGAESAPGTTAALLYIDGLSAYWVHIGDSRLYHYRNGRLLRQTQDHSLLQVMTAKGVVATGSSAAKSLQNQLYMRLGGERLPRPEFAAAAVEDGDLFLLCSDGFWQTINPAQVLAAIEKYPLGGPCEQYLVNMARHLGGNQCDNISLAMIQWHEVTVRKVLNRLSGLLNKHDLV